MLIRTYQTELTLPPCDPGSERWAAFARLDGDIVGVLPYLNALWKNAVYDHGNHVLTRRVRSHMIVLRPYEIGVSNVVGRGQAVRILQDLVSEINQAWERRAEIEPDMTRRTRPAAMGIYRLLPKTNCRACGQPTCLTFALQLVTGNIQLAACEPLKAEEFAETRQALQDLLGTE